MKYIVYLTTNLKSKINNINKIYIGVHQTDDPSIFDGYIGCGVYVNQPSSYMYPKTAFLSAVKKYGVDAFHRDILYIYDDKESAYKKEAELVDSNFIKLPHVYNMILGGLTENVDKPVYQFDLNGNLKRKWESKSAIADFYNISINRIQGPIKNQCVFLDSFWSRNSKINILDYSTHWVTKITYLYTKEGKLINEFDSMADCAEYLAYDKAELGRAIKNQTLVKNMYYVSNKLIDEFIPKSRNQFVNKTYYVYNIDGNYITKCFGKELMKIINLHSWNKINHIFTKNNNWFKNFYIAFNPIDKIPNKQIGNGISIDVYDKYGNFIEHLNSIKEVREKYNVPSSKLKNIKDGNKYFENYIFKYSK